MADLKNCRFDEVLPAYLDEGRLIGSGAVQQINSKISDELNSAYNKYNEGVGSSYYLSQLSSDIEHAYNTYDRNDPQLPDYWRDLMDKYDKDDAESVREDAAFKKHESSQRLDDTLKDIYERVYDTEHFFRDHEVAPENFPIGRSGAHEAPVILTSDTRYALGQGYADYCDEQFNSFLSNLRNEVRRPVADLAAEGYNRVFGIDVTKDAVRTKEEPAPSKEMQAAVQKGADEASRKPERVLPGSFPGLRVVPELPDAPSYEADADSEYGG